MRCHCARTALLMSARERTGWRDEEISGRHRDWGFNCPAVDLDFLMVEYNLGLPCALVEYKHSRAAKPMIQHPTYRALRDLADGYRTGGLPFVVVRYWPHNWAMRCWPVNECAKRFFPTDFRVLSEREYVEILYSVRSRRVDTEVIAKLNTSVDICEPESA